MRLELSPRYLAILVLCTIVSMLAGTPIELAAAGRTLVLGPTDGLVLLLLLTLPLWFRRLPPASTFVVASLLFVAWVWLDTLYWSIDFRRSVLGAKALLEASVIFLAAWQVVESGELWAIPSAIRVMNAGLAIQIVWAVGRILLGPAQRFWTLKGEVHLPLGDSNFLALFLEFGLMFEILSRRRWWWLFVALDGAGILLTFSRGALLATGLMLILVSIVVLGIRGQRSVFLSVLATMGVTAGLLTVTPALRVLVEAFALLGRSAGSRIEIWQDGWQAAAWRPLTGVGYGAYESVGTVRDAHSLPLALLAETGVPGLALFSIALFAAGGRVIRAAADRRTGSRRPEALGVAAGLATVLLHSLIEPFFQGYSLIWAAAIFGWIMGPWLAPQEPQALHDGLAMAPDLRTEPG